LRTIKLPYNTTTTNLDLISKLQQQYSIIFKYSFNRFIENKTEKEIRFLCKSLNNVELLDSWLVQNAIKDANYLYKSKLERDEDLGYSSKLIFNKSNFMKRLTAKISTEQFKTNKKYYSISSQGETPKYGNRKFKIDLTNNKIIFKYNKHNHIDLVLPNLKQNVKSILSTIETLSSTNKTNFTIKLNSKHIHISFSEIITKPKNITKLNTNRILSIDLNPNNIGVSVLEFRGEDYDVIKVFNYDISKLTNSDSIHNKLRHETVEVVKKVVNICKSYGCMYVGVEDLDIKVSDKGKGKRYNRLVNNKWLRNLFIDNIEKRANIEGIELVKVGAHYSSYIGNLQHGYIDSINSSIEIGRRAYWYKVKKDKGKYFPVFKLKDSIKDQWKESNIERFRDWKELCLFLKNSGMRYRVSYDDCKNKPHKFFRLNCTNKSLINIIEFI